MLKSVVAGVAVAGAMALPAAELRDTSVDLTAHMGRVGINYKF
jgi:hypothetical protein